MIYRCYLLDDAARIVDRENFHAEEDRSARDRAREILFERRAYAAELSVFSRLVIRLTQEGSS